MIVPTKPIFPSGEEMIQNILFDISGMASGICPVEENRAGWVWKKNNYDKLSSILWNRFELEQSLRRIDTEHNWTEIYSKLKHIQAHCVNIINLYMI